MTTEIIKGMEYDYRIDKSHGLSKDGYIADGTESIVYKGVKFSKDGKNRLACVLKFKRKSIRIGYGNNINATLNVLERFKNNELKIFNELQNCRSVVRIYDVIENLGNFSCVDNHHIIKDNEGNEHPLVIDESEYFCVVEEFVDGWSLEEYCRDEYWHLTDLIDIGNNLKRRRSFHEFQPERKKELLDSYHSDYNRIIQYQDEIYSFMIKLCEVLKYITEGHNILHLDIKPDNIMITRYGKEIVLIDFGRSEYRESEKFVQNNLSPADYNANERIERMFQYGTLGYAAPECYVEAENDSEFPFSIPDACRGKMTIESDIFSFGTTFWECLNFFELYTSIPEFAKDKKDGGSYDFYRKYMLNNTAYFDRDLSITSPHYHQKLEEIIKKCTHIRTENYITDSENYYHSYGDRKTGLINDILIAKGSSPNIIKTEDIKVQVSFGLFGVILALLILLFLVCFIFLKPTGSYFAERKIDNIIENYYPSKMNSLIEASIEQMNASDEEEKHNIYNRIFDFFMAENKGIQYDETEKLVELIGHMNNADFINNSIDALIINVDAGDFNKSIEYIVKKFENIESEGYMFAKQIYNATTRNALYDCYAFLVENFENSKYTILIKRLARELNDDERINKIAETMIQSDAKYDTYDVSEYNIKIAEFKHEIQETLNDIG